MNSAVVSDESRILDEEIQGIFFYGKKDLTKILKFNEETGNFHPFQINEEHYTLTQEPEGKYLHHFTPMPSRKDENGKNDKNDLPAKKIAEGVFEWINIHGATESLAVIGGDSTNTITGYKGGAIYHVENMIGHKCHWSICMIHTNELPLRHLIEKLDGKSNSSVGYSGPIGKLLPKVHDFPVNDNFMVMSDGEDLIELPQDVISSLSTDQHNCYLLVKAIKTGDLDMKLKNRKCGPLNHARWLTTGQALMMLWIRYHGLQGETLEVFKLIIKFVLQSYFKLYFDIKVKHKLVDGPNHTVTSLRILRSQDEKTQEIVKKCVASGAYHAHPENVILSLLASENKEDRIFAIDQIWKLRGSNEFGSMDIRIRKTPNINFNATSLTNLIFWDKIKCYEPVFTCKYSKNELLMFKDSPMIAPDFPIHTQSTERVIQVVSKAAQMVYGDEKRDGYVRGMIAHREVFPVMHSKKDILFR